MSLTSLTLPSKSGAYRWFYADAVCGDYTAVFIFMIGSVFSPRYSAALRKGGLPLQHCAVNFALYERGVRWLWVLSEYPSATLENGVLRIGASELREAADGTRHLKVVERTAPWGQHAEASLVLEPTCPSTEQIQLLPDQPHFWTPIAVRAKARLQVPAHGLDVKGEGYHDGNHGDVPLGEGVDSWKWTRVHRRRSTQVTYRPTGGVPVHLLATRHHTSVQRGVAEEPESVRTAWGLRVPGRLAVGERELPMNPVMLESSPFYARMEARSGRTHALGEVADFKRFHLPYVRWMAHFRTRQGAA